MPCRRNEQEERETRKCAPRRTLQSLRIQDLGEGRNQSIPCPQITNPMVSGRHVNDRDNQNRSTYRSPYCQHPESCGRRPLCPRQREIFGPQRPQQRQTYIPARPFQRDIPVPQNPRRREMYVPQNQWQREDSVPTSPRQRANAPYGPRQRVITKPRARENTCVPQCQEVAALYEEIQQCRETIGALANEALNIVTVASGVLDHCTKDESTQTNQYRVCVGASTNCQSLSNEGVRTGIQKCCSSIIPSSVDGCTSNEAVKNCCQKRKKAPDVKGITPDRSDCACDEEIKKRQKSACKTCCQKMKKDEGTCCTPPIIADECACKKESKNKPSNRECKSNEGRRKINKENSCCPPLIIADECACEEEMKKRKAAKMKDKNTCCPSPVDKCECEKYMKKQDKDKNKRMYNCTKEKQSDTRCASASLKNTGSVSSCPSKNACKCCFSTACQK